MTPFSTGGVLQMAQNRCEHQIWSTWGRNEKFTSIERKDERKRERERERSFGKCKYFLLNLHTIMSCWIAKIHPTTYMFIPHNQYVYHSTVEVLSSPPAAPACCARISFLRKSSQSWKQNCHDFWWRFLPTNKTAWQGMVHWKKNSIDLNCTKLDCWRLRQEWKSELIPEKWVRNQP